MDPPECPVCLQPYDGSATTPRVLACGHSACETCLTQLPQPFPRTIRCPACTQLVKFPNPTSLPKNIDLLRFSTSLLQSLDRQTPPNPQNSNKKKSSDRNFVPNLWPHEFYVRWKDWIIPERDVVVGFRRDEVLCSDSWLSPLRCLVKGDEEASLVRVGGGYFAYDSKLNYSYTAKVLGILYGMKDGEKDELGMILRASSCSKHCRIGKVYGLWYNMDDHGVYTVCKRHTGSSWEKFGDWRSGFVDQNMSSCFLDTNSFAMIGMDICETVSALHSEGLFCGCLTMKCFSFDDFGHLHMNINEALAMSRRVRRMIAELTLGVQKREEVDLSLTSDHLETLAFVSPELLFELQQKNGTDLECRSKIKVGHSSDVWSLACVLLWLLMGEPFTELMCTYLQFSVPIDGKGSDYSGLYVNWMEKVKTSLEINLVSEFVALQEMLIRCLNFDPQSRPSAIDVFKCIRKLIVKPKFDIMVGLVQVANENRGRCLFFGELCQIQNEIDKMCLVNGLREKNDDGRIFLDQVGEARVERDLVHGLFGGHVKYMDLKGHLDCITGLTVGGDFLFSSSFDKTVRMWSLQDFTHVHTFMGHEHKVMAVVFVDDEQPLCISGDSGGGIYIWGVSIPLVQDPIKKLFEEKDWRYSGIHALAIAGTGFLYTGSGDKTVKAWSLKDYTVSCIMAGHKSVVSALAICNAVLYSGSWDGTVRLWCLSDHSPLTVLGEDALGKLPPVLSLAAYGDTLVVAHENGCMKIWRKDVQVKAKQAHKGAILAVGMEGKWLFTGGWDKVVNVQELLGDEFQIDAMDLGSISCDSVITALLYWEGRLFVGQAGRVIKTLVISNSTPLHCRTMPLMPTSSYAANADIAVRCHSTISVVLAQHGQALRCRRYSRCFRPQLRVDIVSLSIQISVVIIDERCPSLSFSLKCLCEVSHRRGVFLFNKVLCEVARWPIMTCSRYMS